MKAAFRKLKIGSFLYLLVLTLIILNFPSLRTIPTVHGATEAKLFVEPQNNTYYTSVKTVGDTIVINVSVANITDLFGVEFKLSWDPTLLKGVSMQEVLYSTLTPPDEEGNIWPLKHIVADDHVWYSYTYLSASRAISEGYAPFNITVEDGFPQGKMTIATITLEIIKAPQPGEYVECNLDIYDDILGDLDLNNIPHETIDGYYKLIRPPLTPPLLKVEPATYKATQRNETFEVNVTINNLDALWEVVGIQFTLGYDPDLLELVDVTEGPFLPPFGASPNQGTQFMTRIEEGYIIVGDVVLADENGTWHQPFPNGNGTVATITFKVIHGPPVSCNLELYDILISDWNMTLIDYEKQDGLFVFNTETLHHEIVVDGQTFTVVTTSNATISPVPMLFLPRYRMLAFNVTGEEGALCFINITIPSSLLWLELSDDEWLVLVGGEKVVPTVGGNATYTWLYFEFTTSQKPVYIIGTGAIPEFSAITLLLLMLAAILSTFILRQRKGKGNPHIKNPCIL